MGSSIPVAGMPDGSEGAFAQTLRVWQWSTRGLRDPISGP
jgi:hypothetical protein